MTGGRLRLLQLDNLRSTVDHMGLDILLRGLSLSSAAFHQARSHTFLLRLSDIFLLPLLLLLFLLLLLLLVVRQAPDRRRMQRALRAPPTRHRRGEAA